jgi:lysophospholipase L1-like esterase
MTYRRYVAIGDSTSEGIDDPDGRGGYRGWANRLAERLAGLAGGSILYANLAIRGKLARQIREEQLARAVAMRPDVATVVAGMNDLFRRHFDEDGVREDVAAMQRALIADGTVVLTFTLPDLKPVLPIARFLGDRVERLNRALHDACAASGARFVDVAAYPVASDPRLWSEDRFHANSEGHRRISEALAESLGLPGADGSWREPLPPQEARSFWGAAAHEWNWQRRHFLPWVARHARGRSSGDGRDAKRGELREFVAE